MFLWIYILVLSLSVCILFSIIIRGLYYLYFKFPYRLKPQFIKKNKEDKDKLPSISVFVPCKGMWPELKDNIKAMLNQDYPDYKLFFITESKDDPASSITDLNLTDKNDIFHHVVAGYADSCCQKNYNLLKGIDYAKNNNLAGEIYVFADADIRPPDNWLRNMILPLVDESIFVVSGFRSLVPDKNGFSEQAHSAFSALQCMAMTDNLYGAVWGGSMAFRRKVFEQYDIYKTWASAIVDDLSVTSVVKKHKLKRVFFSDCLAGSSESFSKTGKVLAWFIRQNQYAAAYLRFYTLLGIFLNIIIISGILMLPISIILAFSGIGSWVFAGFHTAFYFLVSTGFSLLSFFRKQKGYEPIWFLYAPCFLMLGLYCALVGFFSRRMTWSGTVYHFDNRGNVIRMERKDPVPTA